MAVRTNILLKLSNFVDSLITFAKLQNIATNKILGRTTAGSGVIEELDIANYSNKLIPLTTTFADAENTTSEIDIVTVTIPANSLAVGDMIVVPVRFNRKNDTGGTVNITQKLFINTTAFQTITTSIAAASTELRIFHNLQFIVESITTNTVLLNTVLSQSLTTGIATNQSFTAGASTIATGAGTSSTTVTTFDNTTSNNFKISVQWASSNATTFLRVIQAQAHIIKKAV